MNKAKVHKIFSLLFKTIILLLSLIYIYYKIFYNQDINKISFSVFLASKNDSFVGYLLLVLLLMPLNWGIEVIKWRYLILKIERLSFYDSLKAVLVGITFSSFTPNRIGDYFGRAFMLNNSKKSEGVLITIIGSIAQSIVTIVAGTIGLIWLENILLTNIFFFNKHNLIISLSVMFFINTLILLLYFKLSFLNKLFLNFRFLKKLSPYTQIFARYSFYELLTVLFLSLLRYFVFIFQFYLLLLIFNIEISLFDGLAIIAIIYLVTTIIPTIALSELGIKSAAAIYIFELYYHQTVYFSNTIAISIVSATFILWLLNLAIPALIGGFYVFNMKLYKKPIDD